ncbi:unnamed protein product, partial [Meganyctiphanes norvegica]
ISRTMDSLLHCALYLLFITNIVHCNSVGVNVHQYASLPETEACPNAEDISPCSCTNGQNGIELDCSQVEDDDDLARVFSAPFPQNNVYKLTIQHNNHIRNLTDDIFGDIKFVEVHIKFCELQYVGKYTFKESDETLEKLDLQSNLLSDFPFDTLDDHVALKSVVMNTNKFTFVPILNIPTLEYFALHTNPLTEVPEKPFVHLPYLETLYLSKAKLTSIPIDMFPIQFNLTLVDFSLNQLTTIDENTFLLVSDKMDWLYLMDNSISTIQPGAFAGMRDMLIALERNNLVTLEEAVFGELLQNNVILRLTSNPLVCMCDVAWIVRNPDVHHLVDTAHCAGGQRLVDLDPSDFDDCPNEQ